MAESQGNGGDGGARGGQYSGPAAHTPEVVHDHHDDPAYITRTKFLTGVAVVTGGVMTAAILVPVVGFAAVDSLKPEDWQWVDVGALSDFPEGKTTSIAVSGPDPEADRRAFVRNNAGALTAIWNRCAHLGCPVSYSAGSDAYACPCHGGAYDAKGLVVGGPPPRPLDRFDIKITTADGKDIARQTSPSAGCATKGARPDARVLLGKAFSVDANLNPYSLKPPGEATTGVLANLYPFT